MCHYLHISTRELYDWAVEGKIQFIRTKGGHRRYPIEELQKLGVVPQNQGESICYCRVSSSGQKEDLDRQVLYLRSKYPTHTIVKDIGSGLSFKRKNFRSLLVRAIKGNIKEIVVTHKDRLCRFGFEILEEILTQHGGKIVVLNREDTSKEQELVSDLLAIITSFSGRVHGLRSGKIRNAIRDGAKNEKPKVPNLPGSEVEGTDET